MDAKPPMPVAPEFLDRLQETAVDALGKWLDHNGAPPDVAQLVRDIQSIGAYCTMAAAGQTPDPKQFGIAEIVIETINECAALGAKFHGPWTHSRAREPLKWQPGEPAAPPPLVRRLVAEMLVGTADANSILAAQQDSDEQTRVLDLVKMVAAATPFSVNAIADTDMGRRAMAEAIWPEVTE